MPRRYISLLPAFGMLLLTPIGCGGSTTQNVETGDAGGTDSGPVEVQGTGLVLLAGALGGPGNTDGTGSAARFNDPSGVTLDVDGNLYVADGVNHTIRKIAPNGTVTTLAGKAGQSGRSDGTGEDARFYYPFGVAVDGDKNVYVADRFNRVIRMVTPEGIVTTVFGSGQRPSIFDTGDGTGTDASFYEPSGIALGGNHLYVADGPHHTIRMIDLETREVTTLAGKPGVAGPTTSGETGDGTGSGARFNNPQGIVVDGMGNLEVADTNNHTIRRVTPNGEVTTIAGSAGMSGSENGTGDGARFKRPVGVGTDGSGNLYVADQENQRIRKITPNGIVNTLAGKFLGSDDGTGDTARFARPNGVVSDSIGNLYVSDRNHTLRMVTPAGVVTTIAGKADGAGPTEQTIGSGDGTGADVRFFFPSGVASDSEGNLYVADTTNDAIRKVTANGIVTTFAGKLCDFGSDDGTGEGARFHFPSSITVDESGVIYVADTLNQTIRRITPDGVVNTLAGKAGEPGPQDPMNDTGDGTGSDARFTDPGGIAVDRNGIVYVADTSNHTIRMVTQDGVVTTLAGKAAAYDAGDGTGADARFDYPNGLAIDTTGDLFVADSSNCAIRKVTRDGIVTTFAGRAGECTSLEGAALDARFNYPMGVALDRAGNVYVADTNNAAIRKIDTAGQVTTFVGIPGMVRVTPGPLPAGLAFPAALTVTPSSKLVILDENSVLVVE
jgi:hypothetical protein